MSTSCNSVTSYRIINNVLATEKPEDWADNLLQKDKSCRSLFKLYRVMTAQQDVCQYSQIIRKLFEALLKSEQLMSPALKARFRENTCSQAHVKTRSDSAVALSIRKILAIPATRILPAEIWGNVARKLIQTEDATVTMMLQTCNTFRSTAFLREAFKDIPWLMKSESAVIEEGKPLVPASFLTGFYDFITLAVISLKTDLTLKHFDTLPGTGTHLEQLANLFPNVTHIDLSESTLAAEQIEKLSNFKELRSLSLDACSFDVALLKCLPTTLATLSLSRCRLDDSAIELITHLGNLVELDISKNSFTSAIFVRLPQRLVRLNLEDNKGLIQIQLLARFNQLSSLNIRGCSGISQHDLHSLPHSVQTLMCDEDLKEQAKDLLDARQIEVPPPQKECVIL